MRASTPGGGCPRDRPGRGDVAQPLAVPGDGIGQVDDVPDLGVAAAGLHGPHAPRPGPQLDRRDDATLGRWAPAPCGRGPGQPCRAAIASGGGWLARRGGTSVDEQSISTERWPARPQFPGGRCRARVSDASRPVGKTTGQGRGSVPPPAPAAAWSWPGGRRCGGVPGGLPGGRPSRLRPRAGARRPHRDRVSTHHLGHLRHGLREAPRAVLVMLVEHHQHERLQGGAHPLGIDPGVHPGDHPLGAQPRHPSQGRRRRQTHCAGQVGVRDVSPVLERIDDRAIDGGQGAEHRAVRARARSSPGAGVRPSARRPVPVQGPPLPLRPDRAVGSTD